MLSPGETHPISPLPRYFAILSWLAALGMFALHNLPWHLDDYDQAKQAWTSYEMIGQGHWLFQHTPIGRVATKPPLIGWISAGLFSLTGSSNWEFAWRMPAFAAAITILVLLWRSGRQLAGPAGALLAAAAFAFNQFSPRLATLVRTDMPLAAFLFIPGWIILQKLGGAPWRRRDGWLLFSCLLGSMLTKGPIGYAFLLPGLVAYQLIRRKLDLTYSAWPARAGWWLWFGPLLFFGIWAGIGIARSPEFYNEVVVREFLGRFTVGEQAVHHNKPPGYYTLVMCGRFAPWSLLALALLGSRRIRRMLRKDPQLLWLSCWVFGGLLLMECVPSKRFDRILPIIPPLCLLLPAMMRHLPEGKLGKWKAVTFTRALTILTGIVFFGFSIFTVIIGTRQDQRGLVRFGHTVRELMPEREERIAVVSGMDEGLPIYLGQQEFTPASRAVHDWKIGRVVWLVLPTKFFTANRADLEPLQVEAEVPQLAEKASGYVLIRRTDRR